MNTESFYLDIASALTQKYFWIKEDKQSPWCNTRYQIKYIVFAAEVRINRKLRSFLNDAPCCAGE
jgi:hypothetical protein